MENQIQEDEISLKEIILKLRAWWQYLYSKWIWIAIASIIGGSIGIAYNYSQKPIYTAELTFVLEGGNQGSNLGNYAGLASQFGLDMGGGGGGGVFEGANLIALIKSRSMIEKALLATVDVKGKKETLAEFYIDIKKLREKWVANNSVLRNIRFLPGANPSKFSLEQNGLISGFHSALIGSNLFVDRQDLKSNIISLKVKSEDELFSKYFAEVLTKEVSEFYVETKIKKSVENLTILQHQTDSVKAAFNSSINAVATSTDANPNPNPSRQALRVPSQRKQLDVQISQAMLTQLVQNLEMAKMSLRTETPLIQVIDTPILPLPAEVPDKIKSLLQGFIVGAFMMIFYLSIRRLISNLLAKLA